MDAVSRDKRSTAMGENDTKAPTGVVDAPAPPTPAYSQSCMGYAVVLIGVLVLSLDALVIDEALAEGLNDWALVFYRYLLSTATVLVFMTVLEGGPQYMPAKFEKIGGIGVLASCFQAFAYYDFDDFSSVSSEHERDSNEGKRRRRHSSNAATEAEMKEAEGSKGTS